MACSRMSVAVKAPLKMFTTYGDSLVFLRDIGLTDVRHLFQEPVSVLQDLVNGLDMELMWGACGEDSV